MINTSQYRRVHRIYQEGAKLEGGVLVNMNILTSLRKDDGKLLCHITKSCFLILYNSTVIC